VEFTELTQRALAVRAQLEEHERRTYGRAWSVGDLLIGMVGDVGDLAKLILAHEGVRTVDDADRKLEHELSDLLWSSIVLADKCGVDLEAAFVRTMADIETALQSDTKTT
jgi:NTP pyrophosphatase (non-canonical NTP hydrolase)